MKKAVYATVKDVVLLAEMNSEMIAASGHDPGLNQEELEQRMRIWLETKAYQSIIFYDASRPIGYVLFGGQVEIQLRQFLIRSDVTGRGHGRNVFLFLLKDIWREATSIHLDVHPSNSRAISFWRSLGFDEKVERTQLWMDKSKMEWMIINFGEEKIKY
ncbi:hypothetical protein A9Q99_23595 [Gammaproteobacteria bacterium 45_16_T64]|nr:hypothetical protein A9Q99_23595 [Gammaproteobacteria bacterium 45_16_T64]